MKELCPVPNLNELVFELEEWAEDIDVSDMVERDPHSTPTREYNVIKIPEEARRSSSQLETPGEYFFIIDRKRK